MRISDWSPDVCSSDLVAPISEYRHKTRKVRDYTGNDADLLDAYVYGTFDLGDRELAVQLGRQVLNWGESRFVLNGINSILAFASNQLHVPGDAIHQLVSPNSILRFAWGVGKHVSVEW